MNKTTREANFVLLFSTVFLLLKIRSNQNIFII